MHPHNGNAGSTLVISNNLLHVSFFLRLTVTLFLFSGDSGYLVIVFKSNRVLIVLCLKDG